MVLCGVASHCFALHCIVFCCVVLHCIVLYHYVLKHIGMVWCVRMTPLNHITQYRVILSYIKYIIVCVLSCMMLHYSVSQNTFKPYSHIHTGRHFGGSRNQSLHWLLGEGIRWLVGQLANWLTSQCTSDLSISRRSVLMILMPSPPTLIPTNNLQTAPSWDTHHR